RPDICLLPPSHGPCSDSIQRFHYDLRTQACESFIYGGCKGTENNFLGKAMCMQACSGAGEKTR
uniref:BPTI/Kunitz inhibitor domain-containing protein n=1 Tax=Ornithorhynchus anatinus TaxID=9258 RepID=A0A6I8MZH9_ORNAN